MTWKDAIIYVLQNNKIGDKYAPMHYRDITDIIVDGKLVSSNGKTPANTVIQILSTKNGIFHRIADGEYALTREGQKCVISHAPKNTNSKGKVEEISYDVSEDVEVLFPSYGMFWMRDNINWENHPKLLGVQSTGATPIDLSEMRGIYMLYDGREIIYVGQAIDRPILKRLQEHTKNRLATRWNRFSWFSIDQINTHDGSIIKIGDKVMTNIHALANAIEGVLIEGVEPRQNRKQGDKFGFEYYQEIDKEILKDKYLSGLKKLLNHPSEAK